MLDKDTKSLLEAVNKIINPIDEISDEKLKSYLDKSMTSKPERWKGEKGEKTGKAWVKAADKVEKKAVNETSLWTDKQKNTEEPLAEGTMRLSKVHIVHYHDHPEAKEFAKNYTKGNIGDHRETGPTEADAKAADDFHTRYEYHHTRHGFAGSGTTIYHDRKTKANWKVDRHPNGKTFYGTDHHISPHMGPIHEEVEQIDEISVDTKQRYLDKGDKWIDRKRSYVSLSRKQTDKFDRRSKSLNKAERDVLKAGVKPAGSNSGHQKEEVEFSEAELAYMAEILDAADAQELEELSKDTLKSYINRSLNDVRNSNQAKIRWKASKNSYEGNDLQGNYVKKSPKEMEDIHTKKANNREAGIRTAVNKLTKEDIDIEFSEAELAYMAEILDAADAQELEELSKSTLGSYIIKAKDNLSAHSKLHDKLAQLPSFTKHQEKAFDYHDKQAEKRYKGIKQATNKLTKEDVESLDEKRGRPPKSASTSDEPRQHVIQQLQRAKLSLTGGSKVKFKDGTEHHISGTHASKVLDKYMSLKPSEKEAFQTKVGQSHEHLKSEL